jgi:hypothetical protein
MAEMDGVRLESSTDAEEEVVAALGGTPTPVVESQEEEAAAENTSQEPTADSATAEKSPATREPDADDSDDGDETADSETTEVEAKPRARRNAQQRINQLVRQNHERDRENAELRARLEALERHTESSPQPQPVAEAAETPETSLGADEDASGSRPKIDDYDDYDDYVDAVAGWRAEKAVASALETREKAERDARVQAEQAEQSSAWESRLSDARERYEDWDEVIQTLRIPRTPALEEAIVTSEVGPDILYYLGEHLEEAKRLVTMPPAALFRQIGHIEAHIQLSQASDVVPPPTAGSKTETIETSTGEPENPEPARQSPAPVTPVTPSTTNTSRNPDEMPYDDFIAWRKRGGGR